MRIFLLSTFYAGTKMYTLLYIKLAINNRNIYMKNVNNYLKS